MTLFNRKLRNLSAHKKLKNSTSMSTGNTIKIPGINESKSLSLTALEPRILLDAAGVSAAVDGAVDAIAQQQGDLAAEMVDSGAFDQSGVVAPNGDSQSPTDENDIPESIENVRAEATASVEAPTIDLDANTSQAPIPGQNGFIALNFPSINGEGETNSDVINDGQTEARDGVGNGETVIYSNVATLNGQSIDVIATVVSTQIDQTVFPDAAPADLADNPIFASRNDGDAQVNVGVDGPDNRITAEIRYSVVLSGTTTPITGNFAITIGDLDTNGAGTSFEEIAVFTDNLDSFIIGNNGEGDLDSPTGSDLSVEDANNNVIFQADDDPALFNENGLIVFHSADNNGPSGTSARAVQLNFTNTSDFSVIFNREGGIGGGFIIDGNFSSEFFSTATIVDTNPEFANIFTEGEDPVAIAADNIQIADDLDSIGSATIEITNAQADDLIAVTGSLPTGITAAINSPTSITLTGIATSEAYEQAILAITFENTSATPDDTVTREIEITVTDEQLHESNTATSFIQVIDVLTDTDSDGVSDDIDIDDDNDGILDVDEGLNETRIGQFEYSVDEIDTDGRTGFSTNVEALDGEEIITGETSGFDDGTRTDILGEGDVITLSLNGGTQILAYTIESLSADTEINFRFRDPGGNPNFEFRGVEDADEQQVDFSLQFFDANDPDFSGNLGEIAQIIANGGGTALQITTSVRLSDIDLDGRTEGVSATLDSLASYTIEGNGGSFTPVIEDGSVVFRGTTVDPDDNVQLNFLNQDRFEITLLNNDDSRAGFSFNFSQFNFDTPMTTTTGRDSDGDGIDDHLDIDSDNDGITDNIEAQTTNGFIAPNEDNAETLITNQGLNSAYLTTSAAGGPGLTPVNSDDSGFADTLDTDSDNDGESDTAEAGLGATPVTGLSNEMTDADGDGLFDVFETQGGTDANDGFNVNESLATGAATLSDEDNDAFLNQPLTHDVDFRDNVDDDPDNDGIANPIDVDDDNDGILDIDEGFNISEVQGQLLFDQVGDNGNDRGLNFDENGGSPALSEVIASAEDIVVGSGLTVLMTGEGTDRASLFELDLADANSATFEEAFDAQDFVELSFTTQDVQSSLRFLFHSFTAQDENGSNRGDYRVTYLISDDMFATSDVLIDDQQFQPGTSGSFNGQFPDSFEEFQLDPATRYSVRAYVYDAQNDLPGEITFNDQFFQFNLLTEQDDDNDGIVNRLDIDSDNDGITDTIEAQTTSGFIAPSGVGGTPGFTDVNQDGLDDNFDNRTELNAMSAAATSEDALINPVNTDDSDNPDFIDTNSDNEGENDTAEAGLGAAPVTGLSTSDNDADGDGLFDVFDTQNGTTAEDGFNVHESIATGAISLPDTDGDASLNQPLTHDVDFRDAEMIDTDGDGVIDFIDVDDDNDGILDVIEDANTASTQDTIILFSFDETDPANAVDADEGFTAFASFGGRDAILVHSVTGVNGSGENNGNGTGRTNNARFNQIAANAGTTLDSTFLEPDFTQTHGERTITATGFAEGSFTIDAPNGVPSLDGNGFIGGFDRLGNPTDIISPSLQTALSTEQLAAFELGRFFTFDHLNFAANEVRNVNFNAGGIFISLTAQNGDTVSTVVETDLNLTASGAFQSVSIQLTGENFGVTDAELAAILNEIDGFVIRPELIAAASSTDERNLAQAGDTVGEVIDRIERFAIDNIRITTDADGDGLRNSLDIDSDNDGITDNIEAQSTADYIAPSGIEDGITDANMDGLDDNYDARSVNGVLDANASAATEADVLINPVDTDGDGSADFVDVNSDNEGGSDTAEAGLGQVRATGLSNATTDADGDGLFDVFETQGGTDANDGFNVNESLATGAISLPDTDGDASLNQPLTHDVDFRDDQDDDTDGDGVADFIDVDDDNDGILDVDELPTVPNVVPSELGNAYLNNRADFEIALATSGLSMVIDSDGDFAPDPVDVIAVENLTRIGTLGGETFVYTVYDINFSDTPDGTITPGMAGGDIDSLSNLDVELPASQGDADGVGSFGIDTSGGSPSTRNALLFDFSTTPGGIGHFGLDLLDVENSAEFTLAEYRIYKDGALIDSGFIDYADGSDGNNETQFFGYAVTAQENFFDQIIIVVGDDSTGGGLTERLAADRFTFGEAFDLSGDSDGDGIVNRLDIDSDNDGITDTIEAQTTSGFIAPSGVGGTPDFTDVNRDGLDDNFDSRTNLDANSTAATSEDALINPVNTDGIDDPDFLDTDSDNEGENDTAEAGLGTAPVTGLSTSDNDADGDGLFDVFDTQNETTADDGFNVNESIEAGAAALPDADMDASGGVPLSQDVDFRDIPNPPILDLNSTASDANTERGFTSNFITGSEAIQITDIGADALEGDHVTGFTSLTITSTSELPDGENEILQIAGIDIPLDADFAQGGVIIPETSTIIDIAYRDDVLTVREVSNGVISNAAMDALIRSVTYRNEASNFDNTIARTFDFQVAQFDPASFVIDFEELTPGTQATAEQIGSDPYWASAANQNGQIHDADNPGVFNQILASNADGTFLFHNTDGNVPDDQRILFGRDNIPVESNQDYTFNIDIGRQNSFNAGPFEVLINGVSIGEIDVNGGPVGDWQTLTFKFNSGDVNEVNLQLRNTSTNGTGNDFGIDNISLQRDPLVLSNVATATVNLVNEAPPVAQNDAFEIYENPEEGTPQIGVITDGNLFTDNGNGLDSDANGETLSITQINGENISNGEEITLDSGAVLTIRTDGTFDYNPNGAFDNLDKDEISTDTFTYTLSDGTTGPTDSATVTITIIGDNDAPTIDLNGPNLPGTDFADEFVEDQPGQPLANLLSIDAVVQDDEDNISQVSIRPDLPTPNDGNDEFLRIASNGIDLSIRLSDGLITTSSDLIVGDTTFDVDYVGNEIIITNAAGGTFESDDLEGFLRLFAYENMNQDNTNGSRVFEFVITDPAGMITAESTITVNRTNDAPLPTVVDENDPIFNGTVVDTDSGEQAAPILTITPESRENVAGLTGDQVREAIANGASATDLGLISVTDLLAQLNISDIEQSQFGIGVIFADESGGRFQYVRTDLPDHEFTDFELNDPENENALPVPDGQALILSADTYIRFLGEPGLTDGTSLIFRISDLTGDDIPSNPPSFVPDDSGGVAPFDTSSLSSTAFSVSIANDTDGDGVINAEDVDDDNDGILDVDEGLRQDSFSPDSTILTRGGIDTVVTGIETVLQVGDVLRYTNSITIDSESIDAVLTILETGNLDPGGEIRLSANASPSITVDENVNLDPFVRYSVELFEAGTNIAVTLDNPTELILTDIDSGNNRDISEIVGVQSLAADSVELGGNLTSGGFVNGGTVPAGFDYFRLDPTLAGDPTNFTDEGNTAIGDDAATVFVNFSSFSSAEFVLGSTGSYTGNPGIERGFRILDFTVTLGNDSDGDGIADHLDIDSDDDGITDNIEAQSTDGYIAPSGTGAAITDVNQDGLDDNYDTRNGSLTASDAAATTAEAVIDPVDTDGLDNPDFLDPDSDDDGILDVNENGLGVTYAAGDTDGDGLADVFEAALDGNVNDGFIVNEGISPLDGTLPDTDGDAGGTIVPGTADLDYRDILDTDNDGVTDRDDVDDDNDGILDTVESSTADFTIGDVVLTENGDGSGSFRIAVVDSSTNELGFLTLDYFGFTGDGVDQGGSGFGTGTAANPNFVAPELDFGIVNGQITLELVYALPNNNGHDYGYSITASGITFNDFVHNLDGEQLDPAAVPGRVEGGAFTIDHTLSNDPVVINNPVAAAHTIGGVPISVNDMLADGTTFDRTSQTTNNRLLDLEFNLNDGESYGINVVHNASRTEGIDLTTFTLSPVVIVSAGIDTDNDGIFDHLDIDSDNDGITDNIEAQTTAGFIAPSGIGAGITDVNMDGLDDNFDSRNADGTGTLDANSAAATTGDGDGLTPVNTDAATPPMGVTTTADTTPDFRDTDSDGDGIDDATESGLGVPLQTGLSDASTDADGDGLFDVFETAIDMATNDGFVVNEGILPLDGTLSDGGGDASVGTATPLVNDLDFRDLNDPPVSTPSTSSGPEDTPIPVDLVGTDVDGTVTAVTVTTLPPASEGVLSLNGTPITAGQVLTSAEAAMLVFTPAQNFNGTVTIPFTVTDDDGAVSAPANEVITVDDVNDPPVANDDGVVAVTEDMPQSINPLLNDIDPDGDDLTINEIAGIMVMTGDTVTLPSGATVTVEPDGSLTFTPVANQNGPDSFTYQIIDADGETSTATVSVDVGATNDAPVANAPLPAELFNDGELVSPITTAGLFSDIDGDPLTFSAIGLPLGLMIDPVTGEITGTIDPSASVNGPNSDGIYPFTVIATDPNGETAQVMSTITVANPAPTAIPLAPVQVVDNTPVVIPTQQAFTDPDGDVLTFSSPDLPSWLAIDPVTGELSGLVPADASSTGPVSVTIIADDGEGGTSQQTILITPENPAPIVDPLPDLMNTDGQTITPVNLADNFSDPDGDDLTYDVTGLPPGLMVDPATGIVTGTIDNSASVTGPYIVTVVTTDSDGASVLDSFVWTVENLAPVLSEQIPNQSVNDGDPVTIDAGTFFEDPDGDDITFSATGLPPGITIDPITGEISGTLSADASMDEPFVVIVTADDGEGGVTTDAFLINVNNPNPNLVSQISNEEIIDGETIDPIDISENFQDPDGDPLTFTATGLPEGLTIDPTTGIITGDVNKSASQDGPYTIVVTATDGTDESADVFVINVVNPSPQVIIELPNRNNADGDLVNLPLAPFFADPEGDDITFSATGLPPGLTIDPVTGIVTGTLPSGASADGPFVVVLTATDADGAPVTTTFIWTVDNLAPIVEQVPDPVTLTDDEPVSISVAEIFDDPDNDPVTFSATGLPPGLTIDPVTGIISGTVDPSASQNGPFNPVITITDSFGDSASAPLNITVNNPVPVAMEDSITTPEDTPITFDPRSNDNDPDGDPLTISAINGVPVSPGDIVNLPDGGSIIINPDGSLTFTPAPDANGLSTFTYTVSDGQGGEDTATVTLDVDPVQDAPTVTIELDDQLNNEGDDISLPVESFFSDADGDQLTFSAQGLPPGLAIDPVTGAIIGTLADGASDGGPYIVSVTANDGMGGETTQTFVWNVIPPEMTGAADIENNLSIGRAGRDNVGPRDFFDDRGSALSFENPLNESEKQDTLTLPVFERDTEFTGGVSRSEISSGGAVGELIVEALPGDHSVFVQLTETLSDELDVENVEWVIQAQDKAAMAFIDHQRGEQDLVIINRPVNVDNVVINIKAVMDDGVVIAGDYRINLETGDVTLVSDVTQRSASFGEQIERYASLSDRQNQSLIHALRSSTQ